MAKKKLGKKRDKKKVVKKKATGTTTRQPTAAIFLVPGNESSTELAWAIGNKIESAFRQDKGPFAIVVPTESGEGVLVTRPHGFIRIEGGCWRGDLVAAEKHPEMQPQTMAVIRDAVAWLLKQ